MNLPFKAASQNFHFHFSMSCGRIGINRITKSGYRFLVYDFKVRKISQPGLGDRRKKK